jgi:outer membrane receptor protein involved in Fe transport
MLNGGKQEVSRFKINTPCSGCISFPLRSLLTLIALVLMSGTGVSIFAQENLQNGAILGTVTDPSGVAVAGAMVEISGPAILKPITATTAPDGTYRISDLPTGVYQLSYSMQGFQKEIRNDFTLPVGFTARVDVALRIGAVTQTVEVTGEAPLIDVTSTTPSNIVELTALDEVPTTRSIWQVQYMSPGFRPTGSPDVGGSQLGTQGGGTNYGISGLITPMLDGIDTQQNATATGYFFDYDSLQEVQIIPIAQQADIADLGTATITVMKSGGNEFHGDARAFGEDKSLEFSNSPKVGLAGNPMVYFWDTSLDLGGRLIRDKLWFYIGWHDEKRVPDVIGCQAPAGLSGTPLQLITGSKGIVQCEDPLQLTNDEWKGTYQLKKNWKIVGVYSRQLKYEHTSAASAFRPWPTTEDYPFPSWAYKGEAVWTPSPKFLLDAMLGRYSYNSWHSNQAGCTGEGCLSSLDLAGNPWTYNISTAYMGGPVMDTGSSYNTENSRVQNTVNLSYYPSWHLAGNHALQVGYQFYPRDSITPTWWTRPSGSYELLFSGASATGMAFPFNPGTPFEINTYNWPAAGEGIETELGIYVKDNWQIGKRLTLNLGVRFDRYNEHNLAESASAGQFVAARTYPSQEVNIFQRAVPRVGLVYDPFGGGKTVLRAFYGQYDYHPLASFDLNFNPLSQQINTYKWTGPCVVTPYTSCDATPATLAALNTSAPTFVTSSGGILGVVNPNLKTPVFHSFTTGIEHQFTNSFSVRATYVYNLEEHELDQFNIARPLSDYNVAVPETDPVTGKTIDIYTYPSAFAGYQFLKYEWYNRKGDADFFHSIELTATERPTHNWSFLVSADFTRSHLWISQSTGGEAGNLSSAADPLTPNQAYYGLNTTWDWIIKASGAYHLPHQFLLSGFYNYLAGTPEYRTDTFTGIPELGSVTVPVAPLGSLRLPAINLLNLRLGRTFVIKERYKLEGTVDVYNVFNNKSALAESFLTGPSYGTVTSIVPPAIFRLGAAFSF